MSVSYFDFIIPVLTKNLTNLKVILEKGAQHATDVSMSETDLLSRALAPDMFPLLKQIQVATDNAKAIPARLAGIEPITLPDTEHSVAELSARIDTVLAHLATYTPEHFANAATIKVTMPYYPGQYMLGHDYVAEFALANFFFHLNMSYAILRSLGTPLGKGDYIGGMSMHPMV